MSNPRTLVAIAAPEIRDDIVRAARGLVDIVASLGDPDLAIAAIEREPGIELAIVDITALRALARRLRRTKPAGTWQAPQVILVLAGGELQDALGFLQLCRGLLFWEHDTEKLRQLLVITLEGYSGVRAELLPDLITDRLRIGLIERLAPVEQQTLRLLGQALSNRVIARQLNVADPVAKSLVRTVLTKLRLKNRTEAAVLAARWYGAQGDVPARGGSLRSDQAPSLKAIEPYAT